MRFKSFVTEKIGALDFERLAIDCKPFLDAIKGISWGDLPLHGSKQAPDHWRIRDIETRPYPRNTPRIIHDEIDAIFYREFGWAARSEALFVTSDPNQARAYGPISIILPIGKFKSLWSPSFFDLYDDVSQLQHEINNENPDLTQSEVRELILDDVTQMVETSVWHFNNTLIPGLKEGNEIMLGADKVYEIRMFTNDADELRDFLKREGFVK
jgi:hypothetical protein